MGKGSAAREGGAIILIKDERIQAPDGDRQHKQRFEVLKWFFSEVRT
jgi:hypothetical protein